MTEVIKGAAVGAVIGAVEAGAKVAGFGSETETQEAASKLVEKVVPKRSLKSNKKTGKGK